MGHFKLKRTKFLALCHPALELPFCLGLPQSSHPVDPSDSRPATILDSLMAACLIPPTVSGHQSALPSTTEQGLRRMRSWGLGEHVALNVVFLYYTRSYTVLC